MAYQNASDIEILCKGTIYDLTLFAKNQGYNFSCNVIDFENYYHYGTANRSVLNLQNVTSDMVLLETSSGKIELKMDGYYLIDLHITDANNRHFQKRVINKTNTGATYFTIYFGIDEANQLGSIAILTWRSGSAAKFEAFGDSQGNGFYNNSYAYNLIQGLVPIQYTWQSVPSISGKNGILSLVTLDSESVNDGEPVSGAAVSVFDQAPSNDNNIKNLADTYGGGEESSVVDVTVKYKVTLPPGGSFSTLKIVAKKDSIPEDVTDGDKIVDISPSKTKKTVTGLDENSLYYFKIFGEDTNSNTSESDEKHITTSGDEGWSFDYTGAIQTFTAPKTGIYQLETWGAQGGDATDGTNSARGGYGAYAVGEVLLNQGDTIYINVGGQNGYGGGGNYTPPSNE